MSFSDFLELEILDHIFGKGSYTPPTIYVGLSTADPGEAGATDTPPVGGSYARVLTAGADWNTAAAGAIDNANVITFATATGNWGTITYFTLYDALAAGNFLGSGALSVAKAVPSGDTARFVAGALDTTLT